MDTTEVIMDRLSETAAELEEVALRGDENMLRDVLKLRGTYALEMANLLAAVFSDTRLSANPDLAEEFGSRFLRLRHMIAALQAEWRMQDIEARPKGYLEAIRPAIAYSEDMRLWGKQALANVPQVAPGDGRFNFPIAATGS